jgi:hypothetical protein
MTDATDANEGPRAGARQRRRGLYGPPPRLTRTSPLVGRLVWHIGDWGRASEHIGGRWEAVAGVLAREALGRDDHLVVLAETPSLLLDVLGSGLPHADAMRAWRQDGLLALEPLDFKWSLETASARQVSEDTLKRLLATELPSVAQALSAAREAVGLDPTAELELHDGRFVAPEHPANRAALRAEPGLPSMLLAVEPRAFFEPLPGWPAAHVMARWENVDLNRLRSIEAVERFYRLGAGVTGALTRLHTSLFATEPASIDVLRELDKLRPSGRAATLNVLLLNVDHRLRERKLLEERLAQLPRLAYPFGRLRSDLAKAGVPRAVLESRGALGRAYGEVTRELSAAIRAAGQELVEHGTAPEAALEQLAAAPQRWAPLAASHARAVAARLNAPA